MNPHIHGRTFTDVEHRRRVVESHNNHDVTPRHRFEAQRYDVSLCEWVTIACSDNLVGELEERERAFLADHAPWLRPNAEKIRGPIETIEFDALPCVVLGQVRRPLWEVRCFATDEDTSRWSPGRFGYVQQYGGHACCQAAVDAAWFPIRTGEDTRLGQLLRPAFEVAHRTSSRSLEPLELDAIDDVLSRALRAARLAAFADVRADEALHLFRPTHETVDEIACSFRMVTRVRDVWKDDPNRTARVIETGTAPFRGLWDLARWMNVPADELVFAFVYENSD